MKIETIRNVKQIFADEGMWLCNETNKVFAHKVCFGVNADETMWRDITEAEKASLEALWNTEMPSQEKIDEQTYEQIIDILSGEGG